MRFVRAYTNENVVVNVDEEDVSILANAYLTHNYSHDEQAILERIRSSNAWIVCDCLNNSFTPPTLSTKRVSGKLVLANLPGRSEHHASCPFRYKKSDPHIDRKDECIDNNGPFDLFISSMMSLDVSINDHGEMFGKIIDRFSQNGIDFGVGEKFYFKNRGHKRNWCCLIVADDVDGTFATIKTGDTPKHISLPHKQHTYSSCMIGPYCCFVECDNDGQESVTIGPCFSKDLPAPVTSGRHRKLISEIAGFVAWLKSKGVKGKCWIPAKHFSSTNHTPLLVIERLPVRILIGNKHMSSLSKYGRFISISDYTLSDPTVFASSLKSIKSIVAGCLSN